MSIDYTLSFSITIMAIYSNITLVIFVSLWQDISIFYIDILKIMAFNS